VAQPGVLVELRNHRDALAQAVTDGRGAYQFQSVASGEFSRARFTDVAAEGDRIPGAVQTVVSAGATVDSLRHLFGSVRLRYFGPRPLVADDSARSNATRLVNAQVGYKIGTRVRLAVDLFNILDSRASDIDYYYASRLPGEPPGWSRRHPRASHPAADRARQSDSGFLITATRRNVLVAAGDRRGSACRRSGSA
jgi:hypothetical protein